MVDDAARLRLWEAACASLDARVAAEPADPTILERLAELARRTGDLDRAAVLFDRLAELAPSHPYAKYAGAILSGAAPPEPNRSAEHRPAAFMRIADFLPSCEHDAVLNVAREREGDFEPLRVARPETAGGMTIEHDRSFRRQLGINRVPELAAIVGPALRAVLPRMFRQLGIEPFHVDDIECNVSVCLDGDFASRHADRVAGAQRISFLYYFHRTPRRFSGGDLLLYDVPADGPRRRVRHEFTRIVPHDNVLVAFPAERWHEITRVDSRSAEFIDGRFAAAGSLTFSRG